METTSQKRVRVRFAPSPTGLQHIGGLRTALYNYLFARKNGGDFILRIEDTDQKRFVEGALENTLSFLRDFGLGYAEGPIFLSDKTNSGDTAGMLSSQYRGVYEKGKYAPYIQSERLDLYRKYADELIAKGSAYHCFCSEKRLTELRNKQEAAKIAPHYDRECLKLTPAEVTDRRQRGEASVIRFRIPEKGKFIATDAVRGGAEYDTADLDDFILLKSDQYPTYHLANIVDDHLMEITHVLRAVEWLPSLPKHLLIYEAFGWKPPIFAHLSVILGKDGRHKLSKRDGDVSIDAFAADGYLHEALLNFVALLGWNPGSGSTQELFTMDELVEQFSLERLNKSGAVFDRVKLDWMNHHYIMQKTPQSLLQLVRDGKFLEKQEFYVKAPEIFQSDDYLIRVLTIEQERLTRLTEVGAQNTFFFTKDLNYSPELLRWKQNTTTVTTEALHRASETLARVSKEGWTREALGALLLETAGDKRGDFLWPLRVALTGAERSPSPMDVAWVLGKELTLERLDLAQKLLAKG